LPNITPLKPTGQVNAMSRKRTSSQLVDMPALPLISESSEQFNGKTTQENSSVHITGNVRDLDKSCAESTRSISR
jgi:hypothetical protein